MADKDINHICTLYHPYFFSRKSSERWHRNEHKIEWQLRNCGIGVLEEIYVLLPVPTTAQISYPSYTYKALRFTVETSYLQTECNSFKYWQKTHPSCCAFILWFIFSNGLSDNIHCCKQMLFCDRLFRHWEIASDFTSLRFYSLSLWVWLSFVSHIRLIV